MRIEQLIWFIEYVKCQSLTEVGKRFFITPQALSISLKRLEEELGTQLFIKNGHSITVTEAGQILLSGGENIILEYKNMILKLNQIKNEERKKLAGSLVIYTNMLFQRTILPAILNDFYINYPKVHINVFESDTVNIYKKFYHLKQEKDVTQIAFCQRPMLASASWENPKNYVFHTIYKGGYYACAGKDITLHSKESVKKLLKYPTVLYASHIDSLQIQEKELKNPILLSLEEWGKVNITFSANRMELWRQTLLNHRCIGYVHSFLVKYGDKVLENLPLTEIQENIQTELGWLAPAASNELVEEMKKKIAYYTTTTFGETA